MSSKRSSPLTGFLLLALTGFVFFQYFASQNDSANNDHIATSGETPNTGGSPIDIVPETMPEQLSEGSTEEGGQEIPTLLIKQGKKLLEIKNLEGKVSFDSNKAGLDILDFLSIDASGSIYATKAENEFSQVIVKISNGKSSDTALPSFAFAPTINAKSDLIAFTEFDNSERSFGFNLSYATLNNPDEVIKIDSSPTGISLPAWHNEKKMLVYIKGQPSPEESQKLTIFEEGKTSHNLYSAPSQTAITGLAWLGDQIVFTLEPLDASGAKNAKIMIINPLSNKSSELLDIDGKETNLKGSKDGRWLALVNKTFDGDTEESSLVYIFDTLNKKTYETKISAEGIIEWIN